MISDHLKHNDSNTAGSVIKVLYIIVSVPPFSMAPSRSIQECIEIKINFSWI